MSEIGTHVMVRLEDSRVIAGEEGRLRRLAGGVLKVGQAFKLLTFRLADTHLHALLAEPRSVAREFGRRVEISLQHRLRPGVRCARVHTKAIEGQAHLVRTFWYALRQEARHGTAIDPLFEASNLPDLLGLRTVGRWTVQHVLEHLPRVRRSDLLDLLPVRPTEGPLDYALLGDAAAAASGVQSVRGRTLAAFDARIAAVHAVPEVGAKLLAGHLGVSTRTVRRLRGQDPNPILVAAVREQLRLRSAWVAFRDAAPRRLG